MRKIYVRLMELVLIYFVTCIVFFMVRTVGASAQDTFEENLGASVGDIILLLIGCGCVVLGAFNWRVALMVFFLCSCGCYIAFYALAESGNNIDPNHAGVLLVLSIALLGLSLLVSYRKPSGVV